jgi:subtilisin family serine protease
MPSLPRRRLRFRLIAPLLLLLWLFLRQGAESPRPPTALAFPSIASHEVIPAARPWSTVLPPTHGINPLPEGFVETARFEEVAATAFPSPAPLPQGLRARVLLGEMAGAAGRHRFVRIEELADRAEHRLVERRVMPADHLVVHLQAGKTIWELQQSLPKGWAVRHASLVENRCLVSFPNVDADSMAHAIRELQGLSMIASAVADGYVFAAGIPNDPLFNQQWGLHNPTGTAVGIAEPGYPDSDIDAPEAWDYTTGSPNIPVAVIDTGTDLTHPDLVANLWANPGESGAGRETNGIDDDGNGLIDDVRGWDFVNDDALPADDNGHGTHVAGIIGAKGNNGIGVTGVCLNVALVSLKGLRANGSGLWSDVTDAITYARNKGFRIANLSLGAYGSAPLGVQTVFESASGTLFCAAAGNGGLDAGGARVGDNLDEVPFTPASMLLGNVMSIGAIRHTFRFAAFSNYGKVGVDMGAPGESILSTQMGGGYVRKSGTSMASAFVSGAAAMCLVRRNHTPLEIRQMLQLSSKRFPSYGPYLTDPSSPYNKCVTQGWLGLDLTAIQGTRNLRWHQLGTGELAGRFTGRGFGHVLPDGTLKVWVPPVSTSASIFGKAPETLTSSVVSLVPETPYWIGRDLKLRQANGESLFYTVNSFGSSFATKIIAAAGSRLLRSAADGCVLALGADGTVLSMGGPDSWTGRSAPPLAGGDAPALVPGLANIVQIGSDEAGKNHLFLRGDGTLWAAGENATGLLGTGNTIPQPTPVVISGLPPIQEFYFQENAVFCRAMNSQIWVWGTAGAALGTGSAAAVLTPQHVPAWGIAIDFRTVAGQTTAVRDTGAVLRCPGALGGLVPEVLATAGFFRAPSLTPQTYGLNARGQALEAGTNKIYRSGTNPFSPGAVVVPLDGAAFEMIVDPVNSIGLALLSDGRVQSWGSSGTGGLGKGRSSDYQIPIEVPELKGAAGISADQKELTLAWWADGRILSLGRINPADANFVGVFNLPPLPNVAELKVAKYPAGIKLVARLTTNALWFFNLSAHFTDLSLGNVSPQTWQSMAAPGFTDHIITSGGFLMTHRFDGELHGWNMTVQNPVPVHLSPTKPVGFGLAREIERGGDGFIFRDVNDQIWTCRVPALPIPVGTTFVGPSPGMGVRSLMSGVPMTSFQWPLILRTNGAVHGLTNVFANPGLLYDLYPAGQTLAPLASITASTTDAFEASPGGATQPKAYTARRTDGTVWTFGGPPIGRGVALLATGTYTPARVPSLGDVTQLFPGYTGTFVRRVDGSVWAWGNNIQGQLGGNAYATPADTLAYNISVQVQANGLELNNWLYTYFSNSELGSINISGDEADPDRDGLTNLEEYALGTDPKAPSDRQGDEVGIKPSFQTVSSEALSTEAGGAGASQGTCYFTVTLKRRARRPGIEYQVLFSDDLQTWSGGPTRLIKVLESEKTVIYRDVVPLDAVARRSAKLVIRKGN